MTYAVKDNQMVKKTIRCQLRLFNFEFFKFDDVIDNVTLRLVTSMYCCIVAHPFSQECNPSCKHLANNKKVDAKFLTSCAGGFK